MSGGIAKRHCPAEPFACASVLPTNASLSSEAETSLPEGMELTYTRRTPKGEFRFDTAEIRAVLGPDVPLSEPEVAQWIRDYVAEGEAGTA